MNFDKRYCQNRVRKRRKKLESLSPERENACMEEERQFKLRRFVKDVNKFIEEKEHSSEKKDQSGIVSPLRKTTKRMKPANARRGLFQNGIQTKFYTRGGFGKEVTARLDEDLQQIICLANKESDYQYSRNYRQQLHESSKTKLPKPADQPLPQLLQSRTSFQSPSHQPSPSPHSNCMKDGETLLENDKSPSILDKLDSKLYPDFTRIVTLSSIESKLIQFRNKSYVSAVKRKLLDIHRQGKKENSEELSCPSDVQKSSVATSPMRSPSPLTEPQPESSNPYTQRTSDSEQGFSCIHFMPEPLKSTTQFLEETIGPGSSCKTVETSPEPQRSYKQTSPPTSRNLISLGEEVLPRRLQCYEPLPRQPSIPPPHNLMMPFDGGGDRPISNPFNWFLPSHKEDSPVCQYFPRRMF